MLSVRKKSFWGRAISYGTVFIQFLFLGLIAFTGPLIPHNLVAIVILLTGIFLGLWAIVTMQIGNFNIVPDVPDNGKMVAKGPYKYIRHPMYDAVLLTALSLVLNHFTPLRMILWLALLADLVLKMTYEEKLLSKHYREYSQYQQRTRRLIPFIY